MSLPASSFSLPPSIKGIYPTSVVCHLYCNDTFTWTQNVSKTQMIRPNSKSCRCRDKPSPESDQQQGSPSWQAYAPNCPFWCVCIRCSNTNFLHSKILLHTGNSRNEQNAPVLACIALAKVPLQEARNQTINHCKLLCITNISWCTILSTQKHENPKTSVQSPNWCNRYIIFSNMKFSSISCILSLEKR
jgi:hypothetical protein